MNNELLTILQYIEQERGISRSALISALEAAILTASRKSIHPASNLTVKIDPASGNIQAWAKLEFVEENPNHDQLLLADIDGHPIKNCLESKGLSLGQADGLVRNGQRGQGGATAFVGTGEGLLS